MLWRNLRVGRREGPAFHQGSYRRQLPPLHTFLAVRPRYGQSVASSQDIESWGDGSDPPSHGPLLSGKVSGMMVVVADSASRVVRARGASSRVLGGLILWFLLAVHASTGSCSSLVLQALCLLTCILHSFDRLHFPIEFVYVDFHCLYPALNEFIMRLYHSRNKSKEGLWLSENLIVKSVVKVKISKS